MRNVVFRSVSVVCVMVLMTMCVLPFTVCAEDSMFYERPQEKTDYAYSFAIVGDTQDHVLTDAVMLGNSYSTTKVTSYTRDLYKWIVNNKDKKKIKWVFGLGDITENENYTVAGSDDQEWQVAYSAIKQLDRAKMPYSLIRGNHDNLTQFNTYFAPSRDDFYTSRVTGYYEEGNLANYYMNFEVGSTKYMAMCLDFGPTDEVLEWANKVVAAHPGRRVIVTTHFYLDRDGSLADKNDSHAPNPDGVTSDKNNKNNGDMIWDKFVRKHKNIIMVLSGHLTYRNVGFSQRTGDHGNTVSQFLIDPQDQNFVEGFVCMLYFSEDGKEASAEWISTARTQTAQKQDPNAQDILYRQENQFDFTVTDLTYSGADPAKPIVAITTTTTTRWKNQTTTTTTHTKNQTSTTTATIGNQTTTRSDVVSSVGGNITGEQTMANSSVISSDTSVVSTTEPSNTDDASGNGDAAHSLALLIVIGGVAVVAIALVVVLCLLKKRKQKGIE